MTQKDILKLNDEEKSELTRQIEVMKQKKQQANKDQSDQKLDTHRSNQLSFEMLAKKDILKVLPFS